MECRKDKNSQHCTCTYPGCSKHGICCDCLAFHLANRELPGCCFPAEAERRYDRSFEAFTRAWKL